MDPMIRQARLRCSKYMYVPPAELKQRWWAVVFSVCMTQPSALQSVMIGAVHAGKRGRCCQNGCRLIRPQHRQRRRAASTVNCHRLHAVEIFTRIRLLAS